MNEEQEQVDVSVVINNLSAQVAKLTTDLAVRDAIIESYRAKLQIEVEPVVEEEGLLLPEQTLVPFLWDDGYVSRNNFNYRLACEVPEYSLAVGLSEGIKVFDKEASITIKESQVDDFWEFTAQFNLEDKSALEAYMIGSVFEKSVIKIGGRRIYQLLFAGSSPSIGRVDKYLANGERHGYC